MLKCLINFLDQMVCEKVLCPILHGNGHQDMTPRWVGSGATRINFTHAFVNSDFGVYFSKTLHMQIHLIEFHGLQLHGIGKCKWPSF